MARKKRLLNDLVIDVLLMIAVGGLTIAWFVIGLVLP